MALKESQLKETFHGIKSDEIRSCRFAKGKNHVEILVYAHPALLYKDGKKDWNVDEIVASQDIFTDAKKGQKAGKQEIENLTGIKDKEEAIKYVLDNGKLNITEDQRKKIMDQAHLHKQRLNDHQ